MKQDKNLTIMNKISWMLIIIFLIFISLTFCERPDQIILQTNTNVEFQKIDPVNVDPGSTDIPVYLNPGLTYGKVTDIEGNIYRTIQIGSQIWMAENLRTTKFNDGTNIRNGFFGYDTKKYGTYWWYNNDPISYKNSYGALYNWYAVNTKKLCPTGWHVPSDDEWKQLEIELGMTLDEINIARGILFLLYDDLSGRGTDQGDKLKTTILWQNYEEGKIDNGTNSSGFSAIPCGIKDADESMGFYPYYIKNFFFEGLCTCWWSSSEITENIYVGIEKYGVTRGLFSSIPGIFRGYENQTSGFSIRCLKD
jgi:uncharacterized protein (TIGR02145 family)